MTKIGLIQRTWNSFSSFLPWHKRNKGGKVSHIYTDPERQFSEEKQKKLESLCESLFEKQELITAGKIQFLGLGQIKEKLGPKWPKLQKYVHHISEESIKKYLEPKDIYIRYKDDTYVIIFANSDPEEAQRKGMMIAQDIQSHLFGHEEEEIRNITVSSGATALPTQDLKKAKDLDSIAHHIARDIRLVESKLVAPQTEPKKKIQIMPTIEVGAKPRGAAANDPETNKSKTAASTHLQPDMQKKREAGVPSSKQQHEKRYNFFYSYLPFWDAKRNALTTYLCLARKTEEEGDPIDNHRNIFRGATPTEKFDMDIEILRNVIDELGSMEQEGRKLNIACPVHYDTLYKQNNFVSYMYECQNIASSQKKYLTFLLLDLPAKVHISSIHKFSIPLRQQCAALYADVPLDTDTNFDILRECKFDSVGFRLRNVTKSENSYWRSWKNLLKKPKKLALKAPLPLM